MLRGRPKERLREFLAKRAERKGILLRRLRELLTSTEVLDAQEFITKLRRDIAEAREYVLVISPFLRKDPVDLFLSYKEVSEQKDKIRIVVITKPVEDAFVRNKKEHKECIETLRKNGISVFERERLHFKAVIVDNEILYIGSINPLSLRVVEYLPEDYMLRFVSEALTTEIIDRTIGWSDFETYITG